jgi:hypothetical protein
MLVAGRLLTRNGDVMNTFISSALDAADLLALARLDDDGAPPAVGSPQPADGQTSHAYRVARSEQPAASQAEATGPEHSHGHRRISLCLPGREEEWRFTPLRRLRGLPPWGPNKITVDGRGQLRALGFNV